ncbi:DUF3006 domain-containing protein [Halobacillus seohaensis]|uniref:DUF3006 domain-containing protein n=1 Tax=Halobacillus seohaensis TaxID=447421 RepID=A0ABW2ES15_9BACI
MKAVLDRIEENQYGVLLVEEVGKEFILTKDQLPEGSKTHDWFEVTIENNEIAKIIPDHKTTAIQKEKVRSKRERLKKRSKGSKFKRK